MIGEQYDADYFLHGKETGKSLFTDYHWMPGQTIPMVERIVDHCGIARGARVLDFGCARGYVVRALRGMGYEAFGIDASEWAIRNADEEAKPYLSHVTNSPPLLTEEFDWIVAKDVLEHITYVSYTVRELLRVARRGVFAVVPLSPFDGAPYVVADYERDVTHVQRHKLGTWMEMFFLPGWSVEGSYRVPGVKDNWYKDGWEKGNGFITARRIGERG